MDTEDVGPSTESGPSFRQAYKSNPTTKLLFVNSTSDSSSYRVGNRKEIRSHVRKGVARRFKQKQTYGERKLTAEPRSKTLATYVVGRGGCELSSHDREYPTSLVERSRLGVAEQDPFFLATNLPFREVLILDDEPNATDDTSAEESELIAISSSKTTKFHRYGYGAPASSKTCSQQLKSRNLGQRLQKEGGSLSMRRGPQGQMTLSPLEILGAGRVDPFWSYPVEKPESSLHELMDFGKVPHFRFYSRINLNAVVTYMVPGLRPDDMDNFGPNSVSKAWFSASLTSPLLFHALAFAGSVHMDFMHGSPLYPISPQALSHKLRVIRKLAEIIENKDELSRDECVLVIFILASYETLKPTKEVKDKRLPFNSPLKRKEWLAVSGRTECVPEHKMAILYLLNLRGGLEALKLSGVAECIAA
jgi:hypothetical protein